MVGSERPYSIVMISSKMNTQCISIANLYVTCLKHKPRKKKWPIMKIQLNMKETPIWREGKKSDYLFWTHPDLYIDSLIYFSHHIPRPFLQMLDWLYYIWNISSFPTVIVYVLMYLFLWEIYLKSDKSKSSMKPVHCHILYKYRRQRNAFHVKI